MSLKKLNSFTKFDAEAFLTNKSIIAISDEEWKEKDGDQYIVRGRKVKCLIFSDNTDYGKGAEDRDLNAGEQLVIKVPQTTLAPYQKGNRISLINPSGTVYGEFRNQLSLKAEKVTFMPK
ncbi:hypothetical protein SCODD09_01383 [Streptococcus constellatus]|nr:hypothetical protein SCODD09_01383 [Streptococcus constellatus]